MFQLQDNSHITIVVTQYVAVADNVFAKACLIGIPEPGMAMRFMLRILEPLWYHLKTMPAWGAMD